MNKFNKGGTNEFRKQGPNSSEVENFHNKSDVDSGPKAQHHTLGFGTHQAAPGSLVKVLLDRVAELEAGGGGGGSAFTPRHIRINRLNTNSHLSGQGTRVVTGFDNEAKNINWPEYDLSNGILTIPEDGVYTFFAHVRFSSSTSTNNWTVLSVRRLNAGIGDIVRGAQIRASVIELGTSGSVFLEAEDEIVMSLYTEASEALVGSEAGSHQVFTATRIA